MIRPTDWDELVINRKGTLYYVGACPNDPTGNCTDSFSLHDNRLQNSAIYNWSNLPVDAPVSVGAEQKISFGPEKGKKKTHITSLGRHVRDQRLVQRLFLKSCGSLACLPVEPE